MYRRILTWIKKNPQHVSLGAFFLWGVSMRFLANGMGTIWTIPILVFFHAISALGIYFGIRKNQSNERSLWGIGLNSLAMVYNLGLDILWAAL